MKASVISLEQYNEEISVLKKAIESSQKEVEILTEQIAWLKKQLFGQKAEKFVDTQHSQQLYFEGFEYLTSPDAKEETRDIPAHKRKKRSSNGKDTIILPEDLPVERQIIDISEEEKIYAETGEQLVKIGEEVTSKLAHRPGSYFIKQIVRPKYALPKRSEEGVFIAPLPDTLLNRCLADESLLADILVKKIC